MKKKIENKLKKNWYLKILNTFITPPWPVPSPDEKGGGWKWWCWEECWVEWIVMFCVGESKWALLRVHVSTERVLVLGTACRWQSMWVNNQPYARPSRMYINAGRCVGACFTAETLGYNWCISLLSAWFDGIFEDALYPFIFYFLFFFIFWVAGQVKLSSKEMLSLGLGARIKVDD